MHLDSHHLGTVVAFKSPPHNISTCQRFIPLTPLSLVFGIFSCLLFAWSALVFMFAFFNLFDISLSLIPHRSPEFIEVCLLRFNIERRVSVAVIRLLFGFYGKLASSLIEWKDSNFQDNALSK